MKSEKLKGKSEKLKVKSGKLLTHFSLLTFHISLSRAVVINQLFRFLSGLTFQILLTHSSLNSAQVGVFETIIFAWVSISLFWINAYINTTLIFLGDKKNEKQTTVTFLARQFIIASILNFIFAYVFAQVFSPQIFKSAPFIYFFWGAQVFLNATNFIEPKLIAEKKAKKILEFGVFNLLIPYILLGTLIFLGINWYYAVLAFFVYSGIIFLIYVGTYCINPSNKKLRNEFWKSASPLIGYATTNNLTTIFTQSLVLSFYKLQPNKFAEYRYGVRELPFILAITNGFGLASMPSLNDKNDLFKFREASKKIMLQIFLITWILLLTSRWTIPLIFSEKFNGAIPYFNLNLLLVLSRALMPQIILRAKNAQLLILYAGIIETVFILLFSYLLMPYFGAPGVVFALVIGFLIEKIILAIMLQKRFSIKLKDYTPVKLYFFYSFFTLVVYFLVTR